ncbi:hypothetical protein ACFLRU_03860 [Bacteroidota bacterium]
MKFKFLILLALVFSSYAYSQSTIDIIRASNYYSKAVSSYKGGSYSTALQHLKNSESNLKGKTNKDLEYLKIMTYYRLKDFKKAYQLVTVYLDKGYRDRTVYYKNIDTYNKSYNVNYDEALTAIFVELEDKYTIVTTTSSTDVIGNIVNRIKSSKKDISYFIDNTTKSRAKIFVYDYRTKKFRQGYGGYAYGKRQSKYVSLSRRSVTKGKDYVYYSSGDCSVKVTFRESNELSKYKYSYKYRFYKNYVKYSSCIEFPVGCQIWNGRTYEDVSFSSSVPRNTFKMKAGRYDYCYDKSKTYSVDFTEKETLILEQSGNMQKLREALSKVGLY